MRIHSLSKILLALCFALCSSLVLTGCGANEPDIDVKSLAEAVGHADAAAIKDFKLADKEASSVGTKFAGALSEGISAEEGKPSKESLDALQKAMDEKLKELKFKTEVVSKSDKSAKVKVTTDYIDFTSAWGASLEKFSAEADKLGLSESDPKAMEKAASAYINVLAQEIKNAKVEGQQTFEVEVTNNKDKGRWMPSDVGKFQDSLSKYMVFKDGDDGVLSSMMN